MFEIDRGLATRLRETGVRIDVPDKDTVFLRSVPVNALAFSKPTTNVLVKRPRKGMPFLVCVDEDLNYVGTNPVLARLFAGAVRQEGWRILSLGGESALTFEPALERALTLVGFDGRGPSLGAVDPAAETGDERLIDTFGVNLTEKAAAPNAEPTVGRAETIEEVVSCVLRWGQVRLPLVVGESGVGKTNLLLGVARRLAECRPSLRLVSVNMAAVLAGTLWEAERETLITSLCHEAAEAQDLIVAVEHLELAVADTCRGGLVLARHLDGDGRLIGTTLPPFLPAFARPPLARRIHLVEVTEPSASETVTILNALRGAIAAHHRVEIDETTVQTSMRVSQALPGCFPAKAIAVLDAAASQAAIAGASVVGSDDIYYAATRAGTRTGEPGE